MLGFEYRIPIFLLQLLGKSLQFNPEAQKRQGLRCMRQTGLTGASHHDRRVLKDPGTSVNWWIIGRRASGTMEVKTGIDHV